jgi:hypothetical protein
VLVVPYGYREGRPVHELEADGIVASVGAVADRVRYVAKASAMSFDFFFKRPGRRGNRRWRRTSATLRWR